MLQNLRGTGIRHGNDATNGNEEEDEEDFDIPPEIEEVIDTMLTGLRDKVRVVLLLTNGTL